MDLFDWLDLIDSLIDSFLGPAIDDLIGEFLTDVSESDSRATPISRGPTPISRGATPTLPISRGATPTLPISRGATPTFRGSASYGADGKEDAVLKDLDEVLEEAENDSARDSLTKGSTGLQVRLNEAK